MVSRRVAMLIVCETLAGCGPSVGAASGEGTGGAESSTGSTSGPTTTTRGADTSTDGHAPDLGAVDPCDPIVFADPDLATALRLELELAPDAVLDRDALQSLEIFGASNAGIDDLEGLQCAPVLRRLVLGIGEDHEVGPDGVHDLSPIAGMATLTYVQVEHNAIAELVPLPHVEELELRGNPLASVAGLVGSDALHYLVVDDTPLSELAPLAELPSLTTLVARDTAVTDVAALAGSPVLDSLTLDGSPVGDLSPLAELPALRDLFAARTQIVAIDGLAGAAALEWLIVTETAVADISVVAELPALQVLGISQTPVADLSVLQGRPLERLFARAIAIDALPEGLEVVSSDFSANGLVDVSPMATWQPPGLVDLSDNAIVDLAPLLAMPWAELDHCVELTLHGNPLGPDAAAIADEACATLHVRIDADDIACWHDTDCLPPP